MFSESAFLDTFSENKILYKKTQNAAVEIFEYSTNSTEELYAVTFTIVGTNKGDYVLKNTVATGNIFEYAGINMGNYNPIIQLVAPTKNQVFVLKTGYNPSEKTRINTEIAMSNNDANLFSDIDNNQNAALAAIIGWEQIFIDKKFSTPHNSLSTTTNGGRSLL
jgi:hypothetical protein